MSCTRPARRSDVASNAGSKREAMRYLGGLNEMEDARGKRRIVARAVKGDALAVPLLVEEAHGLLGGTRQAEAAGEHLARLAVGGHALFHHGAPFGEEGEQLIQ